jgi:hypothetical protein
MVVLGMANGFFRGLILNNIFDETSARQLSSITLIILLIVYVYFIYPLLKIRSAKQALVAGILWAFLTFIFETLLGYFVSGLSIVQMMSEYNIFKGKLWVLVLFTLSVLPVIFYWVKGAQNNKA